ncbi:hypothetical protein F441_02908 [Phytophthora nicotianae CJ01A1]|uniref:RxLR effector protein n=1 Tax=Phytophthora nicotianae CJ01A1 TaxID=1317063 RepID=W2XNR3_PHYNI|nr:hypothetical protein F441_02908 [Phytophthora nicotianae CJ01A1]
MKFFSVVALLAIIAQYTQCTEANQMLRSSSAQTVDVSDENKPAGGKWDGKMNGGNHGGRHPRHSKGSFDGKRRHGSRPSNGMKYGVKNGKGRGRGGRKAGRTNPAEDQSTE